jgi:bifunctional ADP-heptose synthase (sugar kinase/adenylyltransferase)
VTISIPEFSRARVVVKGGDCIPEEIVGAREVLQHGGEVRVLAFRGGHSSIRIIDRLGDE